MAAHETLYGKNDKGGFYRGIVTFNQHDYPNLSYPAPGYETATIKTSGCGVCSLATIISNRVGYIPVETVRDIALTSGARVPGGTNLHTLINAIPKQWNFIAAKTDDLSTLLTSLKAGHMAIANTGGDRGGYSGVFSSGGHYVCVVDYLTLNGRHWLIMYDTGYYIGKYSLPHRKTVKVRDRFLIAPPEILDKDCDTRSPRYYII